MVTDGISEIQVSPYLYLYISKAHFSIIINFDHVDFGMRLVCTLHTGHFCSVGLIFGIHFFSAYNIDIFIPPASTREMKGRKEGREGIEEEE